jgi:hypothetical protein
MVVVAMVTMMGVVTAMLAVVVVETMAVVLVVMVMKGSTIGSSLVCLPFPFHFHT